LLSGEAAISNGAASPITVVAADGRITALEADFNLRREGREVSISCLKGSLTVERGGATTPLTSRQQMSYGGDGVSPVSEFNPSAITAWRRGMLLFDFTPVDQVIAEVNRYRAGRIILLNSEIGRRLLSARLRTNETDKLIVQLVHLFGARARELPGGIVVLT
jgi:transmembrane sensor